MELLVRKEHGLMSDREWNSVVEMESHLKENLAGGTERAQMIPIFARATLAAGQLKTFDAGFVERIISTVCPGRNHSRHPGYAYGISDLDKYSGAD